MTKLQLIIDTVKNDFLHSCKIIDLLEKLKEKHGIVLTKRQLLTCYVRKTLKLEKPHKKKDRIDYIPNPKLPELYSDLKYNFRLPENMEEIFFLFVNREKRVPSLEEFKGYIERIGITFPFDWNNRNNFHSMKKKIINMLRDCNELP